MANSSSKDETDTLPERTTRIQPCQFEPARQDFDRVLEHRVSFDANPSVVFHGVCEIALTEVLATQMGVLQCSKSQLTALQVSYMGAHALLYLGSSVNC